MIYSSDDAQNQAPFNRAFFDRVLLLSGGPGYLQRYIMINLIDGDQAIFIRIRCPGQPLEQIKGKHAMLQFLIFSADLIGAAGSHDNRTLAGSDSIQKGIRDIGADSR